MIQPGPHLFAFAFLLSVAFALQVPFSLSRSRNLNTQPSTTHHRRYPQHRPRSPSPSAFVCLRCGTAALRRFPRSIPPFGSGPGCAGAVSFSTSHFTTSSPLTLVSIPSLSASLATQHLILRFKQIVMIGFDGSTSCPMSCL